MCRMWLFAQDEPTQTTTIKGMIVPACIYKGDTIPWLKLPTVYIFKPLKFKNERDRKNYDKMVLNIKKTLPIAKEIKDIIIETYEYMQTIPNEKDRDAHLKKVEKSLMQQYKPRMKKLTLTQGKLLIKLVYRETNSSTYQLVKATMGLFKATFYQTFASLFGASLKSEYDPEGKDAMIERIVLQVESGQL